MKLRTRVGAGAGLVGLSLLALTATQSFAQPTDPSTSPTPGAAPTHEHMHQGSAPTHEQMHEMMDAMHGPGATERMHEMMGQGDAQRGEQLMKQCVNMMGMMHQMPGMMGR